MISISKEEEHIFHKIIAIDPGNGYHPGKPCPSEEMWKVFEPFWLEHKDSIFVRWLKYAFHGDGKFCNADDIHFRAKKCIEDPGLVIKLMR